MGKINAEQGGSDRITGEGMPEPVDGTSYDDTPGVNGPQAPEAPAEFTHSDGQPYRPEDTDSPDAAQIEDSAGAAGSADDSHVQQAGNTTTRASRKSIRNG
jgi:hypothetical protein